MFYLRGRANIVARFRDDILERRKDKRFPALYFVTAFA